MRDASPNSEGYQSPDAGSNKGCSPPPDTDSDSSDGDSEECSSIDDDQTICTSNYGSEGNSSGSLDYFSLLKLLEKDPPLAEIPLTAKEKKLIGEFYREKAKLTL
ncbi:hypothetical protein [Wolbachia pipientis]|uniref:hypothetical protein n=1 Tax=Wolbachia pipientis TaxID=955 RepID=UPI00202E0356|nr:hypothetical protein [Wolbachia pipientis]MCM1002029.1 hypothetical protein [Wolbachia pipientis]